MKRTITLLAASLLMAAGLSACTNEDSGTDTSTGSTTTSKISTITTSTASVTSTNVSAGGSSKGAAYNIDESQAYTVSIK
jgi:predicted small secreted protein